MGFENCHPVIIMIYFCTVIFGMVSFKHPIFLMISFLCAFIYSIKRNKVRSVVLNIFLLPFIVVVAFYYSSYNHFGITILEHNMIGNNITLESLVYGTVLGIINVGVIMWCSCIYSVITTDKIIYIFGRISPKFSMYLSILFRLIPRTICEIKKINVAQSCIGRGVNQGNVFRRIRNFFRILSIVITWVIESLATASESMRSRGSTLKGRKAFSIYRFDNRDRAYVTGMFTCITVTFMGVMLEQTDVIYNPRIIVSPITNMSFLFYLGYSILCVMPFVLDVFTEYSFNKSKSLKD